MACYFPGLIKHNGYLKKNQCLYCNLSKIKLFFPSFRQFVMDYDLKMHVKEKICLLVWWKNENKPVCSTFIESVNFRPTVESRQQPLQELSGVPCGRVPQTNDMTNHLFGFAYWAVKVILTIEAQTSLGANAQNHLCFLCNYLLIIWILWPAMGQHNSKRISPLKSHSMTRYPKLNTW